MDYAEMTFVGLMTIGATNVLTFFFKDLKSEYKFAFSVLIAFGLTFVPADIGNIVLEKAKVALQVAFLGSGTYKLVTRAGGLK